MTQKNHIAEPVTLVGQHVTLIPLALDQQNDLISAAADDGSLRNICVYSIIAAEWPAM